MKRKCYALLSLLLAVCMVLPMGVFVGAADETITATVKGSIVATSGEQEEDKSGKDVSACVAVEGFVDITVSYPSGYTLQAESTNNGVTLLQDNGSGKYRVIGTSTYGDGKDTITFTATKKDAAALVATVTVTVVEPVIVELADVTLTNGTVLNPKGTNEFKPDTEVSVKSLRCQLSTWDDDSLVDGNPAYVEYSLDGSSSSFSKTPITLKGGDSKLYIRYNDGTYNKKTEKYDIVVKGKTIDYISVAKNGSANPYEETGKINLKQNILVSVKYNGEIYETPIGENYTIVVIDASGKEYTGDLTKENYKNYSFYVKYDGVRADRYCGYGRDFCPVSEVVDFNTDTPKSFTMDVRNATKKDYIEGDTLDDFRGVTVTVSYQNSPDKTFKGDEIKSLNLYIHPFVYGEKNIIVEYGDLLSKVDVSYLNIARKGVTKIKAIDTNVKKKYAVGDKLDLTGLQIELTYNDGKTSRISYSDPKIECSPAHGSTITASMKKVMILYTGEDGSQLATSFDLTVTTDKKINSADLAWGSNGKTEYFVGETFKPAGFRVTLFFNDGTKETLALDSSKLSVTYSVENGDFKSASSVPSFTKAQNAYVIAKIKYGSYADAVELQIPVSVTKRPNLKAITAVCTKTNDDGQREGYFVGDVPSVRDFEITVYYDDNSTRSFIVDKEETVNARTPYNFTRKEDGVTYTVKLTPTKIEEDTKKITVSYNEYVTIGTRTNKTVETEVEVKVTVPDCILKHYTSTRNYETKAYESLYDALVDATDTYYDEIQLCRDVTMSTDYASDKTLEIDLNGHTLTMIRGEIYVRSSASSSTKITFTNSSRDDAHIRYTNNEDDDIIVAYNKEYVIDRSSKGDGRYDVTITSVKNGKVTGPTEVIHGHDAKFTITPDEGYEIAAIKVNSKTYKASSDNTLLIEDVREKLTVTVTFQEKAWQNPFTDVSKYATYYKAVQFVYEEGLFNGTSATKFEPDTTMTRAMFVTVLGRLAGVNVDNYKTSSFSDVATGQWYSEYVEWASSIGLVEGYGNGKFGPNDSITHAQMYVLMERYADIIEGKTTTASGTSISANDVRDIPDWAYEAVEYAAKKDFLVVSSYKLTPNDNAKRSELAMLLQKFCKNVLEY